MPSTATPILKLEDQATGENRATWGTKTDNNLELVEQAIKGVHDYSCAVSGNLTLDDTQFVANDVRRAMIRLTGSRDSAGQIIVPTRQGWWFFENATTGGFDLTVKTSAGSGVTLPASGGVYGLFCDGTDVVDMELVNDTLLQTELAALSAAGFTTTSTTSNAISPAGTNLSFTTADSGKAFAPGTPLRIARTADPANYYMDAIVTSYSGTSLGVTVGDAVGSGTFSAWSISVAGGPSITQATIVRRAVTVSDTVELSDNGGLIDVTSGSPVLTLPDGATAGTGFNVRVINTGTGAPIVNCSGSDTINGMANHTFLQYQFAHFYWNGTEWTILLDPRKKPRIASSAGLELNAYYDGAVVAMQTAAVVSLGAASVVGAGFQTDIVNDAATGVVTVSRSGSDSIEDTYSASNNTLYLHRGAGIRVVSNGSNAWNVIADTRPPYETWAVALSDETTAITTGAAKTTIRFPYGFEMVDTPVAGVTSASTSGVVTVDINDDGSSIFSGNKLTIDANEKDSTTAASVATIAVPTRIASGSLMTFDVDTAGTAAKGLKVYMLGRRTP